ncbi:hypothetical protein GGP41_006057 [Bipolaris sorokiniana]|uniref:Uncharacterized protein n=1 Tax=Cochliobolus sativus TaxID=45130 RepID=A0A8H5ZH96_COCSA|nr:hypothetical protein GGP41_006057 [Bipolaris sorokiniana]
MVVWPNVFPHVWPVRPRPERPTAMLYHALSTTHTSSRPRLLTRHQDYWSTAQPGPEAVTKPYLLGQKGPQVCLQLPNRSSRPARRCLLPRRADSARRLARAHPEPYEAFAACLKHSCHVSDTHLGTSYSPPARPPISACLGTFHHAPLGPVCKLPC